MNIFRSQLSALIVMLFLFFEFVIVMPAYSTGINEPYQSQSRNINEPPMGHMIPEVSYRFIQSSQNILENELNEMNDIYFYIMIMDTINELTKIPDENKVRIIDMIKSFQNKDGGFGDWKNDRSMVGTTRMAVEILGKLGSQPDNITGIYDFINRLQVLNLSYGNFGFRAHLHERDADVSSTFDAVKTLGMLGMNIPNRSGTIAYLKNHQNLDGGFGLKTNRLEGIYWPSTAIHTYRGVEALNILSSKPEFFNSTIDFLKSLQMPEGVFANTAGNNGRISYSYDVVLSLKALGQSIPSKNDLITYIKSNQVANGGFIEYALDTFAGLHTTFYAVKTLSILGSDFDKLKILRFTETYFNEELDGGFSDHPGMGSNTRFTFDAVSVLNLIGNSPLSKPDVESFIQKMQNDDGGFGENNKSNTESTFRSILALNALGAEIHDYKKTISYLRNNQNTDGGFGFTDKSFSTGAYSYRALRALSILGSEPIMKDKAVEYFRSLQNPDGGFGNYFGEGDSDLGSTYRAIRALNILKSSPNNQDAAENFILSSQNPNGGFKRSPNDNFAPQNFSRSIFTYDAVLGLKYLNRPINDPGSVYNFIESLRNPDLGFSDETFFTSSISSTFTALYTYYNLYSKTFNNPPMLNNGSVDKATANSSTPVTFSVDYSDPENQFPEYLFLILDDQRIPMKPSKTVLYRYEITMELPVGNHTYMFLCSDGFEENSTGRNQVDIYYEGNPPEIDVSVNPLEGTESITFTVSVKWTDRDGDMPVYVRASFDDESFLDMNDMGDNRFEYSTKLVPGIHRLKVQGSDGINTVVVGPISQPYVYESKANRPDWETFLKIRDLINRTYDEVIAYTDVSLDIHNGEYVWAVNLDDGTTVYVDHDGNKIINDGDNSTEKAGSVPVFFTLLIAILIISALGAMIYYYKSKKGKSKNGVRKNERR